MDTAHVKQLNRDLFERGFGQGDLSVVDAALAPNATDRHAFGPDEPDMAAHLKGAIRMLRGAFPDLHVHVGHLVHEGNVLAVRVEMSGHHTGDPIFGLEPAGAAMDIEQFHVVELTDDGLGLRHWGNVGVEEMREQLVRAGVPAGA